MKVLLFGASGMVGSGVLRECLLDAGVTSVVSVGRRSLAVHDPKLSEVVLPDVGDLSGQTARLTGFDAAFFCLGVSSVGRSEAEYRSLTYDLTVRIATQLAPLNPGLTFVYVSGAGTDSTEAGRTMWARVKGATENAVARLPFRAVYLFRPGIIRPLHGIRSRTASYRIAYTLLAPILWVVRRVAPDSMTTTEAVGRAMLRVARDGAPDRIVGTREINRLAAGASPPSRA